MRRLFIMQLALMLACFSAAAQNYEYTNVHGKEKRPDVKWIVENDGNGGFFLTIINDRQWSRQQIDRNYQTLSWHRKDPSLGNDFLVVKKDGHFVVTGKIDSKEVNFTVKSNGNPWYQSIQFSAGHVLPKDGGTVKYESVMPKTAKVYPMQACLEGECEMLGRKALRVKSGVGGTLAGVWSCHYFIDAVTYQFLCYKGVEGVPGTPETVWTLVTK